MLRRCCFVRKNDHDNSCRSTLKACPSTPIAICPSQVAVVALAHLLHRRPVHQSRLAGLIKDTTTPAPRRARLFQRRHHQGGSQAVRRTRRTLNRGRRPRRSPNSPDAPRLRSPFHTARLDYRTPTSAMFPCGRWEPWLTFTSHLMDTPSRRSGLSWKPTPRSATRRPSCPCLGGGAYPTASSASCMES